MSRSRRGVSLRWLVLGLAFLPHAAFAEAPPAQESWDAVFLAGSKVGHVHTYVEPVKDRGRSLLRVRVDMVLSFKRLNDLVTIKTQYGTIETLDGEVLRLDTRTLAAQQEMRTAGDVVDGKMTLTMDGGGQQQQVTLPWGPDVRGPYATEQSLSRQPMKPGETRTLKMYIPDLSKVCDITLKAEKPEEIELGGAEKRTLLRVEQTAALAGKSRPEFAMTYWVDASGQALKSSSDNLGGMVTYRTTREGAIEPAVAPRLDLILTSVIKITHKIPKPESTRDVRYRVVLKTDDPKEMFPNDRRQTIEPGADKTSAVLEVKTAGPTDGAPTSGAVGPEYLRPNALITSNDPNVVRLTKRAIGNATDPWDKSVKIMHWVAQNLKNKNFESAFAPASEVARTLSGDCTEHGVLTAAMCRAAGVPARVVIGLIYAENLGGFGFHMWNEVHVNGRWVALDATFDESAVDAVHIKLAETSLDGVSPYEAFLPVVRVMGKMTLEPLEIR
jgi:transglutaminase-like putative cysteine protease